MDHKNPLVRIPMSSAHSLSLVERKSLKIMKDMNFFKSGRRKPRTETIAVHSVTGKAS
jgi:hypothetical protein